MSIRIASFRSCDTCHRTSLASEFTKIPPISKNKTLPTYKPILAIQYFDYGLRGILAVDTHPLSSGRMESHLFSLLRAGTASPIQENPGPANGCFQHPALVHISCPGICCQPYSQVKTMQLLTSNQSTEHDTNNNKRRHIKTKMGKSTIPQLR